MPVQSVLTLNTKAYNPRGKTNDVASWALVGDTTFGGATSTVQESVRGPSKEGVFRSAFKLSVPLAASEDSACGCVGQILGQGICDVSVVIPSSFTAAQRADFALRIQGLVANAIFGKAVGELEGSW